jgi:hypothetical protein
VWAGPAYYRAELERRLAGYDSVLLLGDSMGGCAALLFAPLATCVLCFTPQVDVSDYPPVRRADFTPERRAQLPAGIRSGLTAAAEAGVPVTIHYGAGCTEDCAQLAHLDSSLAGLDLVPHDYAEHTLSIELRRQGKLVSLVQAAYDATRHAEG